MARRSGLSVTAVRFYANHGVLAPARIDERTGYRWYADEQVRAAELLAAARGAGMPLAESARLLDRRDDPTAAAEILDRHLRRAQQDLAGVREGLDRLRLLLDLADRPSRSAPTWLDVRGAEFAAALSAISFAVGTDARLPALRGVLLDLRAGVLTLIATDRHRLAVASLRAHDTTGASARALVPLALFERSAAVLDEDTVTICVDGGQISLRAREHLVSARCLDHEYPDCRRTLRCPSTQHIEVDAASLCRKLAAAPIHRVHSAKGWVSHTAVLAVHPDRTLTVEGVDPADDRARLRIGVDRDYLLEACSALRCERIL